MKHLTYRDIFFFVFFFFSNTLIISGMGSNDAACNQSGDKPRLHHLNVTGDLTFELLISIDSTELFFPSVCAESL